MSSSRSIRRPTMLVSALLSAVLLAAIPGVAAAKPIVVDDDGSGSYLQCDATGHKVKRSIQAAIDSAVADDTIWVCPGTYPEMLRIQGERTGLTLVSAIPLGALIRGDGATELERTIWIDEVDDVTITGFKIRTRRGDGIWVRASKGALINENDVRPVKGLGNSLVGGIAVWIDGSGRVLDNTVVDAQTGIETDEGSHASIRRNHIALRFGDHRAKGENGIRMYGTGVVEDNLIEVDLMPGVLTGRDSKLTNGIMVRTRAGQTIRGNTVKRAMTGIYVTSSFPSLGSTLIQNNEFIARDLGIKLLGASDAEIRDNRAKAVTLPGHSLYVEASSDNLLIANDLRGSVGPDIRDVTDPVYYPNTYTDNLADDCKPKRLC